MDFKALVLLRGEIKTPPFTEEARRESGFLIRRLQRGDVLSLPQSRPMPVIGARCHELRINDGDITWRIIYRVDPRVVLIAEIFAKKTRTTPESVIKNCQDRLRKYDLGELP